MTRISMDIDIRRVIRWLVWLSAVVLGLGFMREAYIFQFGTETILKDLGQIALDTENCLGSYYSSVLMIIAALLMTVTGQSWPMTETLKFLVSIFFFKSSVFINSFHIIIILCV